MSSKTNPVIENAVWIERIQGFQSTYIKLGQIFGEHRIHSKYIYGTDSDLPRLWIFDLTLMTYELEVPEYRLDRVEPGLFQKIGELAYD